MKNIVGLTSSEIKELHYYIDQNKNTAVRKRCQCILYSYYGMQVIDLMSFFEVDRRSIYNWFHRWEEGKIQGLMDKPGRGLKPMLSLIHQDQVEYVKEALSIHPQDRCQRLGHINTLLPKPVSYDTLRRFELKLRSTDV